MITGALTFAFPCRLFGFFPFSCILVFFSFSLLQFCDCFILFLCYFSSAISLYVLLILCHRKLAYAAGAPLSIYAFIFSPHASLKYLIPLSFLHPVLLKSSFPQVLDRWPPCNSSLAWCCTHKTETLIKHLIWRSNVSFLQHRILRGQMRIAPSTASSRITGHNSPLQLKLQPRQIGCLDKCFC